VGCRTPACFPLSVLLLSVCACAVSHEADASEGERLAAFDRAMCEWSVKCDPASGGRGCTRVALSLVVPPPEGSFLDECLALVRSLETCSDYLTESVHWCYHGNEAEFRSAEVVPPRVPAGASCTPLDTCEGDLVCASPGGDTATCQAGATAGAPCPRYGRCAYGHRCTDGVCRVVVPPWGSCDDQHLCPLHHVCSGGSCRFVDPRT